MQHRHKSRARHAPSQKCNLTTYLQIHNSNRTDYRFTGFLLFGSAPTFLAGNASWVGVPDENSKWELRNSRSWLHLELIDIICSRDYFAACLEMPLYAPKKQPNSSIDVIGFTSTFLCLKCYWCCKAQWFKCCTAGQQPVHVALWLYVILSIYTARINDIIIF